MQGEMTKKEESNWEKIQFNFILCSNGVPSTYAEVVIASSISITIPTVDSHYFDLILVCIHCRSPLHSIYSNSMKTSDVAGILGPSS